MAKKTLESVLQCPTDFLYLWASDDFISQLGDKASIIRSKKNNQYQMLWNTMVENVSASNRDEQIEAYNEWVKRIAEEIQNIYGITPAAILHQLAMGKDVLGKNWDKGVYGISGKVTTTFIQNKSVTVDTKTGKILVDGKEAVGQTPIYGEGNGKEATITGYSYYDEAGNVQFQSGKASNGEYGAVCYTDKSGVQKATGGSFDASTGNFWQNLNNYMPFIMDIINWLKSLIENFLPSNRVVMQPSNTVPSQKEWVETTVSTPKGIVSNKGLLLVGAAAVGIFLLNKDNKKNNQ